MLPKNNFSLYDVNELYNNEKKEILSKINQNDNRKLDNILNDNILNFVKTIQYINEYLYTCHGAIYYVWNPSNDTFVRISKDELKDIYLNKIACGFFNNYYLKCNLKVYNVVCELGQPHIYDNNINLSPSILHKTYKPFNEYDTEVQDKVNIFLNYLLECICNGDTEQHKYVLKWLSKMIQYKKNDSILYLKSGEGCGKSTLVEFLEKYVVGNNLCVKPSIDVIKTSNNMQILGKLLVYFEELPCFSKFDWQGVSGKLKDLATCSSMTYCDKYEKAITLKATQNYMICTNVNAIQNSEGRRYFILDISNKFQQNHTYFGNIRNNCFNNEVGNAFYAYLMEIDISKFNSQADMPDTTSKLDAINERLHSVYKFLKFEYVLKNKGLTKIKIKELHTQYVSYCKLHTDVIHEKDNISNIEFNKKLGELNINYFKSNGYNVFDVSKDDLLNIFNTKKFIHESDEFEEEEQQQRSDKQIMISEQIILDYKKQIEDLQKQLNRAKMQLN